MTSVPPLPQRRLLLGRRCAAHAHDAAEDPLHAAVELRRAADGRLQPVGERPRAVVAVRPVEQHVRAGVELAEAVAELAAAVWRGGCAPFGGAAEAVGESAGAVLELAERSLQPHGAPARAGARRSRSRSAFVAAEERFPWSVAELR